MTMFMVFVFAEYFKNFSQNETFLQNVHSKLVGGNAMEHYIQQAIAGDELAIQHLTTMHQPRLLAKAYTYVRNKQDAEDIVQETFMKAFGALPQLKERKYFATWLYKILIRECFHAMKKKERTEQLEEELIEQMQLIDQESSQDYSDLHNALASLKKDYQVAIILHYFYDFKVFEMAEMLSKPPNTIKMHLHRGRKALRTKLEQLTEKPVQQKDVKRMLKEQLLNFAQKFAEVPADYELQVEDYQEGIAYFMWQGQTKDEGVFIRLDDQGRLDDFAKSPTKVGPAISEEEKLEIAESLLREQYPEALQYYTLTKQKQHEEHTSFHFMQAVGGISLDGYDCRISVTNAGEVINFSYSGYTENPPVMPEKLYEPERLVEALKVGEWTLCAEYLDEKYYSVEKTGIYPIYECELLTQIYDAVTGEPLFDKHDEPKRSYKPFPQVETLPKKAVIEEIVGVTDEWVLVEEENFDKEYEQLNWRPKGWQAPESKTLEQYVSRSFEQRVIAKLDSVTKQLNSFIWFMDIEGEPQLSEEQCQQIAAQFVQTYYPEYVPYLQVEQKNEDEIEEKRAFFRFVIEKDGLIVENQFFHMSISKITGQILMFLSPDVTVAEIEQFKRKPVKPIQKLWPLKGLKVHLEWDKVYGNTEDEASFNRLIYRINMENGAFMKSVHAETGDIIYSLI